tara:strand:+ start:81 stop:491 length:411 start_codon:yes stop_codon:yes gene_type:complete
MDQEETKQLLSYLERISSALERIDNQLPTTGITTGVDVTGMDSLVQKLEGLDYLYGVVDVLNKIQTSLAGDNDHSMGTVIDSLQKINYSLNLSWLDSKNEEGEYVEIPANALTQVSERLEFINKELHLLKKDMENK